jgi:hypothetical protein
LPLTPTIVQLQLGLSSVDQQANIMNP